MCLLALLGVNSIYAYLDQHRYLKLRSTAGKVSKLGLGIGANFSGQPKPALPVATPWLRACQYRHNCTILLAVTVGRYDQYRKHYFDHLS